MLLKEKNINQINEMKNISSITVIIGHKNPQVKPTEPRIHEPTSLIVTIGYNDPIQQLQNTAQAESNMEFQYTAFQPPHN